jgi:hypothetical protein
MSARMIVELHGGKKVLFGGESSETGLSEVAFRNAPKVAADKFQAAMGSLSDLVAMLEKSVGAMAKRPDKVEMEFGASLSGDCDLWIVSAEGKAEFKVTLTWGK